MEKRLVCREHLRPRLEPELLGGERIEREDQVGAELRVPIRIVRADRAGEIKRGARAALRTKLGDVHRGHGFLLGSSILAHIRGPVYMLPACSPPSWWIPRSASARPRAAWKRRG